jgi:hypothetical protein
VVEVEVVMKLIDEGQEQMATALAAGLHNIPSHQTRPDSIRSDPIRSDPIRWLLYCLISIEKYAADGWVGCMYNTRWPWWWW